MDNLEYYKTALSQTELAVLESHARENSLKNEIRESKATAKTVQEQLIQMKAEQEVLAKKYRSVVKSREDAINLAWIAKKERDNALREQERLETALAAEQSGDGCAATVDSLRSRLADATSREEEAVHALHVAEATQKSLHDEHDMCMATTATMRQNLRDLKEELDMAEWSNQTRVADETGGAGDSPLKNLMDELERADLGAAPQSDDGKVWTQQDINRLTEENLRRSYASHNGKLHPSWSGRQNAAQWIDMTKRNK
jgi:chromosome segregation ATPase